MQEWLTDEFMQYVEAVPDSSCLDVTDIGFELLLLQQQIEPVLALLHLPLLKMVNLL